MPPIQLVGPGGLQPVTARRGQQPARQPRCPSGRRMPWLLVVRGPCVTRRLAAQQPSQAGNAELARRPVVEALHPRLDNTDVERVGQSVFALDVGRHVIAERVAVRKHPGQGQENAGHAQSWIARGADPRTPAGPAPAVARRPERGHTAPASAPG